MINFPNNPKVGDAFTDKGTIYTCVLASPIVWNASPNSVPISDAPTDGYTYGRNNAMWKALDKTDVGLDKVDNTKDSEKPVSVHQQVAINAKENTIAPGLTTQYWRGDKTWQVIDKSSIGLGNVDNTADASKTVQSALYVRSGANPAGSLIPFSWADDGTQPTYVWGGNNVEGRVYVRANLSVNYANSAGYASNSDMVDGQHFGWSNRSNNPTYLWGADANGDSYIAWRAGMSVSYSDSSGYANSAGSAPANGGTAQNSNQVCGIGGWRYSGEGNNPPWLWSTDGNAQNQFLTGPSTLSVNYANSCNYANSAGSAAANGGTSTNSNQLCGQGCGYWINNAGSAVQNITNNGSIQLLTDIAGVGMRWWALNASDERIKKNIAPTKIDALAEIEQIEFIEYNFRDDIPWQEPTFPIPQHTHIDGEPDPVPEPHPEFVAIDDGRLHQIGVSAQQLLTINPELVETEIGWYAPHQDKLLYRALMAIQQLSAEVKELRALVKPA